MDVFLSYSRTQRTRIEEARLRRLGFSVWFDAHLESGLRFDEEIDREVRRLGPSSRAGRVLTSDWVASQAALGLERGVLVSVLFEPVQLRPPVSFHHAVDLTSWDGDETHNE